MRARLGPMKVLVTGIDGYSGWPLALHLISRGHEVVGIDNFVTRKRVKEVGSWSATPIPSFARRQAAVKEIFGKDLGFYRGDLQNYEFVHQVLEKERPDSIVHLAEQRSAPYSMIDVHHAVATQVENLTGTLHLLYAMKDACPDAHLVKMGTMGEYGTPNTDIPEGFFDVEFNGRKDHMPFPRQGGSWYHWSKVFDSGDVMFASKIFNLRTTDVMQGVIYGVRTAEITDDRLLTRFDFDETWGTALNRFIAQAVLGAPITPYGRGEQKRGFLALEDSMQSLRLAVEHPAQPGEYRVFNQFDALLLRERARRPRGPDRGGVRPQARDRAPCRPAGRGRAALLQPAPRPSPRARLPADPRAGRGRPGDLHRHDPLPPAPRGPPPRRRPDGAMARARQPTPPRRARGAGTRRADAPPPGSPSISSPA